MSASTTQRIARNTAWFTVGSVLQKLISFVYFTIIAMVSGVEGTGRFFFALTYAALFAVLADWGIAPILTREVARDRTRGLALVIPALTMRVVAVLVTVTAMHLLARAVGYAPDARAMIAFASAALAIDAFTIVLEALLRGIQRVHYEAIAIVMNQLTLTVTGIVVLITIAGLHAVPGVSPPLALARSISGKWLLFPYVLASAVRLAIAIVGCVRERLLRDAPWAAPFATMRWLLRTATPFALTAALARAYTYLDTFLLSILATTVAVGTYSTPFKIAFAFQFLPLALVGALYPAMSAVAAHDRRELARLFTSAVRALLLVAVPLAFGIGFLAQRILGTVYGTAFLPSTTPLILLIASLPFVFVNFPAGYLLNAVDLQVVNTKLLAIATVVNAIANLTLIPPLGATGAAMSALLASTLLTGMNLRTVFRIAPYDLHVVLDAVLRTTTAGLVMGMVLFLLGRALPLGMVILAGAVSYIAAAVALRAFRRSDLAVLVSVIRRRHAVVLSPSAGP